MSVASQSLMDNVTYVDLYKRWEQGNWSAYDIDFSEDRAGWEALSDIQRRSAMWIYSMFYYGEDRVADTLAPYITAAPTEEQSYFLATQQVDEVRHSIFFHRFFKEVIGVGGDSIQQTLSSTMPQLNWGYRGIFDRLDLMAEELRKDRSLPKYAQAITLYHLIVEGSLAQPGQHFIEDFFASEETMPGFSAGMAQRLQRRAAPHRLRRQGALRAARRGQPRLGGEPGRGGRAAARNAALRAGRLLPAEPRPLLHRVLRLLARGHLLLRPQTDPPALAHDRLPDRGDAARRLPLRPRGLGRGSRRAPGEADGGRRPRPARRARARRLAGDAAPLLRRRQARRRPGGRQRLAAGLPVPLQRRRPLAPDRSTTARPGPSRARPPTRPSTSRRAGPTSSRWASRTRTR